MENSRIFVRDLPLSLSAKDFEFHFSKKFPITDAKFIPHKRIGYVGYKTSEDAAKAVKYYNKSYIRMSRIGVDIARPITHQSPLKPSTNATNGVKRKIEDGFRNSLVDLPSNALHQNKKRDVTKRNGDTSKLQEYLDVMQPPSKSKTWKDQVLMVAKLSEKAVPDSHHDNRDREIHSEANEAVPKTAQRNQKSIPSAEEANGYRQADEDELENTTILPNVEDKNESPQASTFEPESDADWLRSRTSRLLGLTDDSDAQERVDWPDDNQDHSTTARPEVRQVESKVSPMAQTHAERSTPEVNTVQEETESAEPQDTSTEYRRLFIRNLTYSTTEEDLVMLFNDGKYGALDEIHLSIDTRTGANKGFAHVQFIKPEAAAQALLDLDRKPFRGRLLHVMPAKPKQEPGLDEFAISKLPLKKQQQIKRKVEAATSTFNWNSMFMNTDAVMSSISNRLGILKSELLDPTSSGAAVKQAHAETHVIQETKAYLTANGVDLDAFKSKERGTRAILIKNFAYGTKPEELKTLFESHGRVRRFLMPSSGTIAIVEFDEPDHARSAFSSLAYRKFKDSILFLEKAPKGLFHSTIQDGMGPDDRGGKFSASELLAKEVPPGSAHSSTLFVQNLNFITPTKRLREIFKPLDGFLSARVKTKPNHKKPGELLSMGFGFVEFRTKESAQSALAAMDGFKLDGHDLHIRASHKATDAAEERRKEDQAKKRAGRRTKIIIKNLPFEVTKSDVRSLFGAYGQLRSVRVPKKFDSSTRGFAFAEFVTAREAENAMDALRDTHLLGRRLVLEFAAEDELDPEQEVDRMQQKVGKQADKVALQSLTGSARKKFNAEGAEELDQF